MMFGRSVIAIKGQHSKKGTKDPGEIQNWYQTIPSS